MNTFGVFNSNLSFFFEESLLLLSTVFSDSVTFSTVVGSMRSWALWAGSGSLASVVGSFMFAAVVVRLI